MEQHLQQVGIIHHAIAVHIFWQVGACLTEGEQHGEQVGIIHATAAVYIARTSKRWLKGQPIDPEGEAAAPSIGVNFDKLDIIQ